MFGLGIVELLLILFIFVPVGVAIWSACQVARKAGFSSVWGLVVLIPIINIVVLWVFAFGSWPALTEVAPEQR